MVELVRRLGWSYVSTVAAEVNNPESLVHYQQHYNIIVFIMVIMCKGLSIYYVIRNGRGGLPDLLQYYRVSFLTGAPLKVLSVRLHRGGLESLLQYYNFEREMGGYNPF